MNVSERFQAGGTYAMFGILIPPFLMLIPAFLMYRAERHEPSGEFVGYLFEILASPGMWAVYAGIIVATFLYGFVFGTQLLQKILNNFDM